MSNPALPVSRISRVQSSAPSGEVVFASLLKFANAGIATAFRDYLALSGTAGSVMFTEAPASVNDYTVFDPEEFPSSGLFLSFSANPPKLWVYFGGQPAWNNIELNA